eukprot:8693767-Karenia_brevis.AAC.1
MQRKWTEKARARVAKDKHLQKAYQKIRSPMAAPMTYTVDETLVDGQKVTEYVVQPDQIDEVIQR